MEAKEEPKKLEDLCVYRHDILYVAKDFFSFGQCRSG